MVNTIKTLKRINSTLVGWGMGFAGLALSLLVPLLLLFLPMVFMAAFISLLHVFWGAEPYIHLNELPKLVLLGITSWYLGVGLSKIVKDPEKYNINK